MEIRSGGGKVGDLKFEVLGVEWGLVREWGLVCFGGVIDMVKLRG